MNEHTTKLLEQLSSKMGTTTEYLWSVLLRQAPIDATTTLFQVILVVLASYFTAKAHKRFYNDGSYDNHEGLCVLMVFVTIVVAILIIISFFIIGDIINGFFNPEYWALKQVLNSIGK